MNSQLTAQYLNLAGYLIILYKNEFTTHWCIITLQEILYYSMRKKPNSNNNHNNDNDRIFDNTVKVWIPKSKLVIKTWLDIQKYTMRMDSNSQLDIQTWQEDCPRIMSFNSQLRVSSIFRPGRIFTLIIYL